MIMTSVLDALSFGAGRTWNGAVQLAAPLFDLKLRRKHCTGDRPGKSLAGNQQQANGLSRSGKGGGVITRVASLHSPHHRQEIPAGIPFFLLILSVQIFTSPNFTHPSKPAPVSWSFFPNPQRITLFSIHNFYLYFLEVFYHPLLWSIVFVSHQPR